MIHAHGVEGWTDYYWTWEWQRKPATSQLCRTQGCVWLSASQWHNLQTVSWHDINPRRCWAVALPSSCVMYSSFFYFVLNPKGVTRSTFSVTVWCFSVLLVRIVQCYTHALPLFEILAYMATYLGFLKAFFKPELCKRDKPGWTKTEGTKEWCSWVETIASSNWDNYVCYFGING